MFSPNQLLKKIVISSALVGMMAATPIAAQAELGDHNLYKGMWDEDVKDLQKLLKEKGFFNYHIATGYFGPITEEGVESFQRKNGLIVDGIVGPNTFAALDVTMNTEEDISLLDRGDRGEAVEDLQKKLQDLGYYTYQIDGIFGPITEDAVTGFQKANHISADGIVGPETRQALQSDPVTAKEVDKEQKVAGDAESNNEETTVSRASGDNEAKVFYVESTAYTANCEGCSGITYTGVNLNKNPDAKVIAVDPDVIPLGSTVWVEGYGYAKAADIGGAIDGKEIDVFFSDYDKAIEWGRKEVKIKVLK